MCPATTDSNYTSWLLDEQLLTRSFRRSSTPIDGVPPEQRGTLWLGVPVHLLPTILFAVILELTQISSPLSTCGLFAALAAPQAAVVCALERLRPATELASPSPRELVDGFVLVVATAMGLGSLVVCASWYGSRLLLGRGVELQHGINWASVCWAVATTDFYYYWYHRCGGHSCSLIWAARGLRKLHLPHHLVAELDFCRGNLSSVLDTAVLGFQWVLGPVSLLHGMDLQSCLIAYFILLQLQATHHANHTFNIGKLRRIFVDSHNHKLHHCPHGDKVNFGACFSMWDRNFGTYYEDNALRANYMQKHKIWLNTRKQGNISNPTRIDVMVLGWWMTILLAVPMVTRVTNLVMLVTTMLGALGFFMLIRFEGTNVKMKRRRK